MQTNNQIYLFFQFLKLNNQLLKWLKINNFMIMPNSAINN